MFFSLFVSFIRFIFFFFSFNFKLQGYKITFYFKYHIYEINFILLNETNDIVRRNKKIYIRKAQNQIKSEYEKKKENTFTISDTKKKIKVSTGDDDNNDKKRE